MFGAHELVSCKGCSAYLSQLSKVSSPFQVLKCLQLTRFSCVGRGREMALRVLWSQKQSVFLSVFVRVLGIHVISGSVVKNRGPSPKRINHWLRFEASNDCRQRFDWSCGIQKFLFALAASTWFDWQRFSWLTSAEAWAPALKSRLATALWKFAESRKELLRFLDLNARERLLTFNSKKWRSRLPTKGSWPEFVNSSVLFAHVFMSTESFWWSSMTRSLCTVTEVRIPSSLSYLRKLMRGFCSCYACGVWSGFKFFRQADQVW